MDGGTVHSIIDRVVPDGFHLSNLSTVPGMMSQHYDSKAREREGGRGREREGMRGRKGREREGGRERGRREREGANGVTDTNIVFT